MKQSPNNKQRKSLKKRRHFFEKIKEKYIRRQEGKRQEQDTIWYGLGLFGIVGWSVAIPTVIGVALGVWIDTRFPGKYSWTLMLLFIGLSLGCFNAWYWVERERQKN